MNLQDTISRVFPSGTVGLHSRGFQVNGLPRGAEPQNCEILAKGAEPHFRGARCDHYLVRVGEALLFFRVGTAYETGDREDFVAGREPALTPEEWAQLQASAHEFFEQVCQQAATC